jgi:hypothetical protein
MGLCIRLLRNVNLKSKAEYVIIHIEKLVKELENASFIVSIAGANSVRSLLKELKELEADKEIGADISGRMSRQMDIFEKIVFAEAQTKKIYVISDRRFNSDYLLNGQDKLLKDGIFSKLSEVAKFDFVSSCRCLVFGESTASAFHILRASEDVLKNYYFLHKKRDRLKVPMWGPMTKELRAKKRNLPPAVILDSLDLVRNSYRNPTQHPEAMYDINSAQDLFGVCLDLINKMGAEL